MLTDVLSVFVLPLNFRCTIVNQNRILPNSYNIKLGIDPIQSGDNLGLGFQRLNYIVENYLESSIFVHFDNIFSKHIDKLDNNIVYYPCETYDIFVGSVLYSKFSSITNKYFDIQYITIASSLGDHVQYNIIDPNDTNLDLEGDFWWNQDNVYTGSKNKVSWDELNLTEMPRFKPTIIKGGKSEN